MDEETEGEAQRLSRRSAALSGSGDGGEEGREGEGEEERRSMSGKGEDFPLAVSTSSTPKSSTPPSSVGTTTGVPSSSVSSPSTLSAHATPFSSASPSPAFSPFAPPHSPSSFSHLHSSAYPPPFYPNSYPASPSSSSFFHPSASSSLSLPLHSLARLLRFSLLFPSIFRLLPLPLLFLLQCFLESSTPRRKCLGRPLCLTEELTLTVTTTFRWMCREWIFLLPSPPSRTFTSLPPFSTTSASLTTQSPLRFRSTRSPLPFRAEMSWPAAQTGSGKCFARGTRLRLYNGETIAVEDIRGGEQLMGDDSTPRTVTPFSTVHAEGAALFTISPTWDGAQPFTVNGDHILVLAVTARPTLRRSESGGWVVHSFELDTQEGLCEMARTFHHQTEAEEERSRRSQRWEPLDFDLSVLDFLSLPASLQSVCRLIASATRHLPLCSAPPADCPRGGVEWKAFCTGLGVGCAVPGLVGLLFFPFPC